MLLYCSVSPALRISSFIATRGRGRVGYKGDEGTRAGLVQHLSCPIDLFKNVLGGGGLDEGSARFVMFGKVVVDSGLEFAFECAPASSLARDLGEKAFHLVQPGSRGWREVDMR